MSMSTFEAPAMTLLSTMSATAAGKSYPMSRRDSVSRAAEGVIAADPLIDISYPPQPAPLVHQDLTAQASSLVDPRRVGAENTIEAQGAPEGAKAAYLPCLSGVR